MSRTFLKIVAVGGFLLLAAGCAQQKTETTPPPVETPAADTDTVVVQLTPERVTELATMTVEIDRNPTGQADVLMKYNMTPEQYSDAMIRVNADSTMMIMFNDAKMRAASMPADTTMPDTTAAPH